MKSHPPGCMSDEECTCQDYDDEQATESDTPETDAYIIDHTALESTCGVAMFARRLERERDKAIEQIKMHNAIMREACEKMDELRRERDEARRNSMWIKVSDLPPPSEMMVWVIAHGGRLTTAYIQDLGDGEGDQWWESNGINLISGEWDELSDTAIYTPTHWMIIPPTPEEL